MLSLDRIQLENRRLKTRQNDARVEQGASAVGRYRSELLCIMPVRGL